MPKKFPEDFAVKNSIHLSVFLKLLIFRKIIVKNLCFITGVPWAGKTLAGLNIANLRSNYKEEEYAVFSCLKWSVS
jgi:hypothetical protein